MIEKDLRLCTDEEYRAILRLVTQETEAELKLRLEMALLPHTKTVTDRLSTLEKTFLEFLLDRLIVLRRQFEVRCTSLELTVSLLSWACLLFSSAIGWLIWKVI